MPDREKVIKALECLTSEDCTDTQFDYCDEIEAAITMLKEQEAVKPVITPWAENEDGEVVIVKRECGRCGYQFFTEKPNYCENCGTPILWEGW